jgi:type III secretion protein L
MGAWRIESDGHLSALELASFEGLRAVEAQRASEAAAERVRLAQQARELKRRAWHHGHSAGKAAVLRQQVGRAAATAFAAQRLEDRLTQIVLGAVSAIVGDLPPSAALTNQLRRAVAVSQSQRLVSVRVAPAAFEEARQLIAVIERELDAPFCTVLADAGLPAHSCVIETEAGVIDGGLKVQLRALERDIRDGVAAVLRNGELNDGAARMTFDMIEQGVRYALAALQVAPMPLVPQAPAAAPASPSLPPMPPEPPPLPHAFASEPVRVFQRPCAEEAT